MCIVVVFFFKQKTAYEMRISDWSSDVCSSDLFIVRGGLYARAHQARAGRLPEPRRRSQSVFQGDARMTQAKSLQEKLHKGGLQIGRASCRARVCQYV